MGIKTKPFSREDRQALMLGKAYALGLTVKQRGPSLFYFTNPSGQVITQYGLWASEVFLQGYEFAAKNVAQQALTLSWEDSDED